MTSSKVRSRLLEELVVARVLVDVAASVPLVVVVLVVLVRSPLRLVAPELVPAFEEASPATAPPLPLIVPDSMFSSSRCLLLSLLTFRWPYCGTHELE